MYIKVFLRKNDFPMFSRRQHFACIAIAIALISNNRAGNECFAIVAKYWNVKNAQMLPKVKCKRSLIIDQWERKTEYRQTREETNKKMIFNM